MLEDRAYMRRSPFETRRSATMLVLVMNLIAFIAECIYYGYPIRLPHGDLFALSVDGLRHGYVWQLLTFQFMHGGILHLLFNCLAIFMIGRDVEEAVGRRSFLTLYFASGIIGGLIQVLVTVLLAGRFSTPVVGASAGAFGLVAAFAMLFPERPLTILLFLFLPITMRAKFLLIGLALIAVAGIAFPHDTIAHAAHLGGMITGMFFVRYVIHWHWQWPHLNKPARRNVRRLVKVPSAKSSTWNSARQNDDDLPPDEFLAKQVDPILEKISAHGLQSLTDRERRILEAARRKMAGR